MGENMTPRVLLAHSMLWPNVARLAISFRAAGFAVDAIAPAQHPIHRMRAPSRTFQYRPTSASESLAEAIEASEPDLLVPCDDRVALHLHRIHETTSAASGRPGLRKVAKLIETSLGSPHSFGVVGRRSCLSDLAKLPDVHIPPTMAIDNVGQLRSWVKLHGLPALLKLEGSSGGRDVMMLRSVRDILPTLFEMRVRKSWVRGLKSLLVDRDPEPFFEHGRRSSARICVQSYVTGALANCAVACWRGEVLAATAVEVVERHSDFGLATVVRRVEGEAMIATARSIARHLRLSGFFGFDFVVDDTTGRPTLIEINPRATQINHFPGHNGPSLAEALFAAVGGKAVSGQSNGAIPLEIALFPQEWRRDPASKWLSSAFHDVPVEEPELVRYFGYPCSGIHSQASASEHGRLSEGAPKALKVDAGH